MAVGWMFWIRRIVDSAFRLIGVLQRPWVSEECLTLTWFRGRCSSEAVINKLKSISYCAVFIGVVFVVLGLFAQRNSKELDEKGVSMPGKITQAEVRRNGKHVKQYILHEAWGEGAERQADSTFNVAEQFFESKVEGETKVVSPDVTVRMIPGDRGSAILVDGTQSFDGLEPVGVVVGFLGLLGLGLVFLLRRI